MKKLEERNVCISNAKHRWNFIKKSTLPEKKIGEDEEIETTTTTGTGSSNSAKVCTVWTVNDVTVSWIIMPRNHTP